MLAIALTLLLPTASYAADSVVSVTPDLGSTISEQPGSVSIVFDSPVGAIDANTTLSVIGPDDKHYETGCPQVDGDTLSAVTRLGDAGTYTVTWYMPASEPGSAELSGNYTFEWEPDSDTLISDGTESGPFCGVTSSASSPSATASASTQASDNASDGTSLSSAATALNAEDIVAELPAVVGSAIGVLIILSVAAAAVVGGARAASRYRRGKTIHRDIDGVEERGLHPGEHEDRERGQDQADDQHEQQ